MLSAGLSFGLPKMSSVPLCPDVRSARSPGRLSKQPVLCRAHVWLLGTPSMGLTHFRVFSSGVAPSAMRQPSTVLKPQHTRVFPPERPPVLWGEG